MVSRRQCLGSLLAASLARGQGRESIAGVERVVAIGDVHGDYNAFVALLRTAKLIDNGTSWTGGMTHLVLPGDFLDRGKDARKVIELLMALEPRAEKAGGQVHALLGNHEAMNVYGDLRYVAKAEYDAFRGPNAPELRDQAMQTALQTALEAQRGKGGPQVDTAAFRKKFEEDHPFGWVERQEAFSAEGKYGKWLRKKNVIVKINDLIFLHGGISPKYAASTLPFLNDSVHAELADFSKLNGGVAMDPDGPLWYRGLAESPENDRAVAGALDVFLQNNQARRLVIGHTPQLAVLPRFQGKVILIDVGLSASFGGPPAFLLVESGKYYAVHRGSKLDLPVDGGNLSAYLRSAAALDPPNSALQRSLSKAGH
jgi:Calcineurin-like phosphoesterase